MHIRMLLHISLYAWKVVALGDFSNDLAYFHNKVRRCNLVNMEFSDTKEQLLLGLWYSELSRTLITAKHSNINELLADIMAFLDLTWRLAYPVTKLRN